MSRFTHWTHPFGESMKTVYVAPLLAAVALMAAIASPSAHALDELHKKHACTACHDDDKKMIGPAYREVAKKYAKDKDAVKKLSEKVRKGGVGVWGQIPMPAAQASVSDADITKMIEAIMALNGAPAKK
jgi:cytochrome c